MSEAISEFCQEEHNNKIEQVEAELLNFPQVDCPVTNHFAPDVYAREIFMPAGSIVIGHKHKTEHFNIVLSGSANVMCDDKIEYIEAPSIFVSKPGVRKVLYILEDMRWVTIHPTKETDMDKLEEICIEKSDSWKEFHITQEEMNKLREDVK